MHSPVWGRPSPASDAPWLLRTGAAASSAAVRADGGDGARWVVRAVSLSGVRHRLGGTGPEDAYAWSVDGERLVVAVADGVSGTVGSAAAASAAVTAAVSAAVESPSDPFTAANDAVRAAGGATTLVVAVLEPTGEVALSRVGDSTAFVSAADGWRELWPAGEEDEPIRTGTAALPADAPAPDLASVTLAGGGTLVLVTDGVGDPLRDGPTTVAPGLAAALAQPPAPLELARILDFSRQGCHDDRTLLAVWSA